ncbi:unnamed protein product [Prunus armeniaca]|uniref:WAT1-related protein n=1 Tax=Prunus armeniaca TaxID=36596 RepID=A0A6J5W0E1_PRUAR|nr:unnamed protein product [Prunus armeniaca]CAB4295040.1 unnamed protein product [Prunus armeniaca]
MAQTGSMMLNKAAMSKGTNKYTIFVYTNALSALILLPSSSTDQSALPLPSPYFAESSCLPCLGW